MLERKSWSNEQYSRRECLKISGLPSSTEDSQLAGTVLQTFEKVDVKVDPKIVKAWHWLKSKNASKMAIIKLSKRKDADKIREVKKVKIVEVRIDALRKMCPYSELFWSVSSRIRTEYGEILHISPYSVRMRENTD